MELVEPIRDKKKLEKMKIYLKGKNIRDYCLFVVGINSGLRISDLLNLKIEDVADKSRRGFTILDRVHIREKKTDKLKDFPLGKNSKTAIQEYLDTRPNADMDEYLFLSRNGDNKPISRYQAWHVLNEASKSAGIKDNVGTHTMRKTFGYWAYRNGIDIEIIQSLLNHASPKITLRYIGITQDDLDSVYLNLNL